MKKKIALLLALVLTLSMLFALTSCDCKHKDKDGDYICDKKNCDEWLGSVYMPEDILEFVDDTIIYNNSAVSFSELTGYTASGSNYDNLVLFTKEEIVPSTYYTSGYTTYYYKVLNVETASIVYSTSYTKYDTTALNTISINFVSDYFTVSQNGSIDLYDANGIHVGSTAKTISYIGYDYFYFDDSIYLVEGTSTTLVTDNPFVEVPSYLFAASEDYFYEVDFYYDNATYEYDYYSVFVYDTEFTLVSEFVFPENVDTLNTLSVLNNGNVFIQYTVALPDDAAEYDIYENGTKYDLVTVIFNAADGGTSNINFNYVVSYVQNYNEAEEELAEDGFVATFTNLFAMSEIVNKSVSDVEMYVDLDDNLNLAARFDKIIVSQEGLDIECIDDDKYIVEDRADKEYLVDGAGEIIGEISDASMRAGFFYKDGKYYDYDLNFVIEVPEDYSFIGSGNGYAIYSQSVEEYNYMTSSYINATKYYLFKNGVFTELSDAKNATTVNTASNYFYTFIYNSGSYAGDYTLTIYNVNGEKIMTQIVANSTYSVNPYGDCVLVSYNVSAYDYTTGYNKTSVNYAVIK